MFRLPAVLLIKPSPPKVALGTWNPSCQIFMLSSASTSSTLVDESASNLIDQLKSTLEGIVVDRHEYQRKCRHSSLRDVEVAMKDLKDKVPKDRGELSRKLARCAISLDAIAAIVEPLFQAGKPVAPIVFASITAILRVCICYLTAFSII